MSKINFIHLRKNISMIFAATYVALSCSIAQAASFQTTSSSHNLDLKSTVAQARCNEWDVGKFVAIQSNTSQPLRFNLSVRDRNPGEKYYPSRYLVGNVKYGNVFGEVIDPGTGDDFVNFGGLRFTVRWNNGATGLYSGRIDSNGYISGFTYDLANTNSTATWNNRKPLQCLQR
jgi:hypothetical protein